MVTQRNVEIGKYLKKLRKSNGFTTEEVANRMKMSTKGINYYELGKREIKAAVFEKLCEIYHTSPDEVLKNSKSE